jgi:hypothetical protein
MFFYRIRFFFFYTVAWREGLNTYKARSLIDVSIGENEVSNNTMRIVLQRSSPITCLLIVRLHTPCNAFTTPNRRTSFTPSSSLNMCQLMGINAASLTDFRFSFRGFARRGGATDIHSHGWGMVSTLVFSLCCCYSFCAICSLCFPFANANRCRHFTMEGDYVHFMTVKRQVRVCLPNF